MKKKVERAKIEKCITKKIFKVEKVRRPLPFKDWQDQVSTKECQVSEAKMVSFKVSVKEESDMKFSFKTFFKYGTDRNVESEENTSQSDVYLQKYAIEDLHEQKEKNSLLQDIDQAFLEKFEKLSDISRDSSDCKLMLDLGDKEFDLDLQMSGHTVFGEMWQLYKMKMQEKKPHLFERFRRRVNQFQDGNNCYFHHDLDEYLFA
mmetsp:Transcript_14386/g.22346  ORF Transcript_14386/g.22346 Transcript_14386/m.22346 type:complete len:204 (+) Transcript_14386:745-1356(+)